MATSEQVTENEYSEMDHSNNNNLMSSLRESSPFFPGVTLKPMVLTFNLAYWQNRKARIYLDGDGISTNAIDFDDITKLPKYLVLGPVAPTKYKLELNDRTVHIYNYEQNQAFFELQIWENTMRGKVNFHLERESAPTVRLEKMGKYKDRIFCTIDCDKGLKVQKLFLVGILRIYDKVFISGETIFPPPSSQRKIPSSKSFKSPNSPYDRPGGSPNSLGGSGHQTDGSMGSSGSPPLTPLSPNNQSDQRASPSSSGSISPAVSPGGITHSINNLPGGGSNNNSSNNNSNTRIIQHPFPIHHTQQQHNLLPSNHNGQQQQQHTQLPHIQQSQQYNMHHSGMDDRIYEDNMDLSPSAETKGFYGYSTGSSPRSPTNSTLPSHTHSPLNTPNSPSQSQGIPVATNNSGFAPPAKKAVIYTTLNQPVIFPTHQTEGWKTFESLVEQSFVHASAILEQINNKLKHEAELEGRELPIVQKEFLSWLETPLPGNEQLTLEAKLTDCLLRYIDAPWFFGGIARTTATRILFDKHRKAAEGYFLIRLSMTKKPYYALDGIYVNSDGESQVYKALILYTLDAQGKINFWIDTRNDTHASRSLNLEKVVEYIVRTTKWKPISPDNYDRTGLPLEFR